MQRMIRKVNVDQKQKILHRKKERKYLYQATPFVLPGLILVCIFIIYPLIKNIQISFSDYDIVKGTLKYTGLQNYKAIFAEKQGRFWLAYRNNILYAVIVSPITIFLGLIIAVLLNSIKKGSVIMRTLYYLPVITSWIIAGLIFKYIFNAGNQGFLNYFLCEILHVINTPINWLKTEWGGNLAIWTLGIWKNVGYTMVIYLAALQGISKNLYEAAEIEGANSFKKLTKITMPLIRPTTFFLIVQMLIGSFNVFLQVLVLTGGEPRGKTSVLQYILYDRTFKLYRFGEGAAIGVITAISILIVTLVLNRLMKSNEA